MQKSGAQVLVDQLLLHDVDTVFCVPGESYLSVLDGLYDAREQIRLITCRMEAGAANMADAYGKLTGKPGICMVTRGPGASHACVGVHTAAQDSTPMILFIGQVSRTMREREAFQEVDYKSMFGSIAKWVVEIDDPRRMPEFLARAFTTATSGRPGPVVIALPEDVLSAQLNAAAPSMRYQRAQPAPSEDDMKRLHAMLAAAVRPVMIVGGGTWTAEAGTNIRMFAERFSIPAIAAFRSQDVFDNEHKLYAGDLGVSTNPKLIERVKAADLILAVGTRLEENVTAGYTLLAIPKPQHTLVHVHPDASELGRIYQADLKIVAAMPQFAEAACRLEPAGRGASSEWTQTARQDYLSYREPLPPTGAVDLGRIVRDLSLRLPQDAIVTNGAGNYTVWVHRYFSFRQFGTQLAPTSGAMGYGVPSAIAAKVCHPHRMVVSFNGDGCFLMCGQELATAVQYGLNPIFIVVNNGMYGTIRMHQERHFPGRVWGTDLRNPDFVALARAYGAHAERVDSTDDFFPTFERAKASGIAALIELRVDPEALTPRLTLSEIRAAALPETEIEKTKAEPAR